MQPVEWLTFDARTLRATVQGQPGPSDISLPVDVNIVVEFLSAISSCTVNWWYSAEARAATRRHSSPPTKDWKSPWSSGAAARRHLPAARLHPVKALLHVARVMAEVDELGERLGRAVRPARDRPGSGSCPQTEVIDKMSGGLAQLAKRRKVRVLQARGIVRRFHDA